MHYYCTIIYRILYATVLLSGLNTSPIEWPTTDTVPDTPDVIVPDGQDSVSDQGLYDMSIDPLSFGLIMDMAQDVNDIVKSKRHEELQFVNENGRND